MFRCNIRESNLKFKSALAKRTKTALIIIHHVGQIERDVTVQEIHGWHLEKGWSGCGYHFVIRKDGTVERGRPVGTVGAHCQGSNSNSIGINVVGDFMKGKPTEAQINSLVKLVADLCDRYKITKDRKHIIGHREKMVTDCPGDHLFSLLKGIVEKVEKA